MSSVKMNFSHHKLVIGVKHVLSQLESNAESNSMKLFTIIRHLAKICLFLFYAIKCFRNVMSFFVNPY